MKRQPRPLTPELAAELEDWARAQMLAHRCSNWDYREARQDFLAYVFERGGPKAHLMRPDEERIVDGS